MSFAIASLSAGQGTLGICPAPGRFDDYAGDLATILDWSPSLVLTMTESMELECLGAETFPDDLNAAGIGWLHLPIRDFGAPGPEVQARWADASAQARAALAAGGRVLAHCYGGCGRSGMALLRLMVEMGEDGPAALKRLRQVRPCAVETKAQAAWAMRL
ncbi:phosphatase domain-containing putative toxin [Shimia sediminis]|uniref:phosphatase domain-containing putative toxin n=1 Tax=Shimia sediminis TaxID=2497945 RepID=UPI000F8E4B40|nr:protein phosphatase [Shimia sediminis]